MIPYATNPIAWSNDDDQSLGVEAEHLTFEGVRRGAFTIPGDPEGVIDLPAVKGAAEPGHSGRLVIEAGRDPAVRNPRDHRSLGPRGPKQPARDAGLDRVPA